MDDPENAFHVVCHECPEEGIYESASAARTARDDHRAETGHRVSLLDIGRSAPNP